jgi:hypothetical protein
MGNAQYQEKYSIEVKKVPLDTYYLSTNDLENYIVEYTDAVYSTKTADWNTVLRGNMYAWILILMYYYGWGHYLAKYMRKQGVAETDLFESMLTWIENSKHTLLYKEYFETKEHIHNTFHKKQFWGRQVYGSSDIYWEYKGASSCVLHDNRDTLKKELAMFLNDVYNVQDADSVVELNLLMTRDKNTKYPIEVKTKSNIARDMLDIDRDLLIINHDDVSKPDGSWYLKAYHYNRKLSYWRCNAS